jgi:nucleotide-binding universal stress UspA family protein
MTLVGSGLTGIGLGATVAPALFVAGFSLPSANLQRVFAIVELMRACAAFMIAPVFAHFAATVGPNLVSGTSDALWIGLAIAVLGAVLGVVIYALSGARPQTPDIEAFLAGEAPAWVSPPLLARVRGLPITGPAGIATLDEIPEPAPLVGATAPAESGEQPVLIAYDGTDLSAEAIVQASSQVQPGRAAVVLTVWRPVDVGFHAIAGRQFDADQATEVRAAAEATAEHGVELARAAGFDARAQTIQASPTWKGVVEVAEQVNACMIVIGTNRPTGVIGQLGGGVASSVEAHAKVPVLLVHQLVPSRTD